MPKGIPIFGDRSARDMDYATLHASDIEDATFTHHNNPANPPPTNLSGLDDVNTAGVADGDILIYDSGTGTWTPGAIGMYRQFVYVVVAGDFNFVIDGDGIPVMALQELE